MRLAAAAETGAPRGPALGEGRLSGALRGIRIGQRNVGRQCFLLIGREAECAWPGHGAAVAPIDERIEHQAQELVHQGEGGVLGAGRILAVEL